MSTMYLRVCSDLHAEQFYGKDISTLAEELIPSHILDVNSILVLAGDISSKGDQLLQLMGSWRPRFRHIVFVCGNHEWYKHDMKSYGAWLDAEFATMDDVSAATTQVQCVIVDGVRFIMGTLWADGGQTAYDAMNVSKGLWDFRIIQNDGYAFGVSDMVKLHKRMKKDITSFLSAKSHSPTIVVTHHMPSYRLCHPRFGGEINGGFASNCDAILASDDAPNMWIHGHTHDTIDMQLFNTRIVCNPRGYRGEVNASCHNTYGPVFVDVKNG